MYNLKNVFGVITFESKLIKIIVVDASNDEQHCLYFKKFAYCGCDINGKLNDFSDTKRILTNELIKTDKFIGIKVKRYILNIPTLPISIANQTFENHNFKSKNDIFNYIDEHSYYQGAICVRKQIIGYVLNNQLVNNLPSESKFAVKCVNYFVNIDIINQYENLFSKLLVNKIDLYTNVLAFKDGFKADENSLLIDINENNCNLVEYGKNKEIVSIQTINLGSNWLVSQLMDKLKFNDNSRIEHLICNIKYLNNCVNNPVVANYYQDKYLKTKQLKLEDFKKISLSTIVKQINIYGSYLLNKNFDEIKINCANKFNGIYSLATKLDYLRINNKKVGICEEEILGLEDENVSQLFYIIKDISKRYEKSKNMKLISIDPFFSEDMSWNQFRKNIIIKFGIQSTKMWSKLGDGD